MSRRRYSPAAGYARSWCQGPGSHNYMAVYAPSQWELMLKDLRLVESHALAEVELGTPRGRQIKQWVMQHHHRSFVPEQVLQVLGVYVWQ